jgi:hypothetical protein
MFATKPIVLHNTTITFCAANRRLMSNGGRPSRVVAFEVAFFEDIVTEFRSCSMKW